MAFIDGSEFPQQQPIIGPPRCSFEVRRYAMSKGVDVDTMTMSSGPAGEVTTWDVELVHAARVAVGRRGPFA